MEQAKITKAVQRSNVIYIDQKVVFEGLSLNESDEGGFIHYYKDYSREIELGQSAYTNYDDYVQQQSNFDWNLYEDIANTYRYTYRENGDGTYTFIQIEKID